MSLNTCGVPGGGSSPRGRGKRERCHRSETSVGLIPAWAGKTPSRRATSPKRAAHPRVGGENSSSPVGTSPIPGSSPRGRGKHPPCARCGRRPRLIPAWAGKTPSSRPRSTERRAHPRVGGENGRIRLAPVMPMGSSPRGRGKPRIARVAGLPRGLIPAWAGKTPCNPGTPGDAQAHPRVGGENWTTGRRRGSRSGSSPRGRGKPVAARREREDRRLIPAWAGKTGARCPDCPRRPAHPRVGGENRRGRAVASRSTGSSPRGRGKLDVDVLPGTYRRLIPAWAGKTLSDLRVYRADRSDLGNP